MPTFIYNKQGQKISVLVEETPHQAGLVFLMHGFGGFKEQPYLQTMSEAFLAKDYTVVRFDCRFALGESDGETIDATATTYIEDLNDVIDWARTQTWFQEPFVLGGASLGGITVAWYAEKYPERIKGVIPFAPVVSGELMWSRDTEEYLDNWRKQGYRETNSNSKPGRVKQMSWQLMEDIKGYDLIKNSAALTIPTLLIVGSEDKSVPVEHVQLLFDSIPSDKKTLKIVPGAPHTFRQPEHLAELKKIVMEWAGSF